MTISKCSFYPPGTPWMAFGDTRSCITTDRICPHRWHNLPHIRDRFCQITQQQKLVIVSKSVEIQLNNLYIIWSCCSYVTDQGSINHQLLKVCPPKPNLEKMAEGAPVSLLTTRAKSTHSICFAFGNENLVNSISMHVPQEKVAVVKWVVCSPGFWEVSSLRFLRSLWEVMFRLSINNHL